MNFTIYRSDTSTKDFLLATRDEILPNITADKLSVNDGYTNVETRVLDYTIQILLAFLIVLANGFVIFTLLRSSILHTPTNLILGGLALSDLGMGVTRPVQALLELGMIRSKTGCLVSHSFAVSMSALSMQHLTIVSVDRLLRIKQPFCYKDVVTRGRVLGLLCVVWTGCTFICFLPVIGFHRPEFTGVPCTSEAILEPWTFHLIMSVNFMFSSLVLTCVYSKIFLIARRKKSLYFKQFTEKRHVSSLVRNLKAARWLAVLCVYFLMSWAPFCCLRYSAVFMGDNYSTPFFVERITLTFAVGNSLGNPLLYAYGDRSVRTAMKSIVSEKLRNEIDIRSRRQCEIYM